MRETDASRWVLSRRSMRVVTILSLSCALAFGCTADGGGSVCTVGADCASGICRADGLCEPASSDAGVMFDGVVAFDSAVDADGMSGSDAVPDGTSDAPPTNDATVGCVPNRDGRIERHEVTLRAGLRATFRVATDASIDTSGEVAGDGSRSWDLSAAQPGDRDVLVDLRALEGLWFADDFEGATYVTELSSQEDLLGVFEVTGDGLLLRGVASPEDSLTATKLTYDPPVRVLSFPLERGAQWMTEASVSGRALGVVSVYNETYESTVDAEGELVTPFGTFDVLRVRVLLTRELGVVPFTTTTTIRTFAFVAECFGTVATINSAEDESRTEFDQAAELRRLAP